MAVRANGTEAGSSRAPTTAANEPTSGAAGSAAEGTPTSPGTSGFSPDSGFDAAGGGADAVAAGKAQLDKAFASPVRWKGFSAAQVAKAKERATADFEKWVAQNPDASPDAIAAQAKKSEGKAWANAVVDKSFIDRLLLSIQRRTQELWRERNDSLLED